jgi:hypothetical protein
VHALPIELLHTSSLSPSPDPLQDGRNWARIEGDHHTWALFDVGAPGSWDSLFIGHPQVLAAGPKDMRMYYHSYDAAQGKYVIGWASSPDGFRWTKEGVMFTGGSAPGDFDAKGAAACQVVGAGDRGILRTTSRFLC